MDLNKECVKVFERLTLIDIGADKVISYVVKNDLKEESCLTYQEYFDALKKVVHPDYINLYFDTISLNNLDINTIKQVKYSKLNDSLMYTNYIDCVKLVSDNVVLIATLKDDSKKLSNFSEDNYNFDFIQLVINIESAINSIKTNDSKIHSTLKYIDDITHDIIKNNKKLEHEYKNKISINVSKTNESLLIVDDDNLTRSIFKKVFEGTYNIIEAQNGEEAVEILEKNVVNPQIDKCENIVGIFLDLKMPIMDGFGVLDYLTDKKIINRMPIIIISADDAKETKEMVYNYDIADMIEKPFNFDVIKKRVSNMTRMYVKNNSLSDVLNEQSKDIKKIIKSYINGYLVNYEDINNKIGNYYQKLLQSYNELNESKLDITKLIKAAKYYDLSLDFIPRKYLSNMQNLTEDEKSIVYNYPVNGTNIIKYVLDGESESFIKYASDICLMHNERYDGKGFPYRIKEDKIPIYVYLFNIAYELATLNDDIKNKIVIINNKKTVKYSDKAIDILNNTKFE